MSELVGRLRNVVRNEGMTGVAARLSRRAAERWGGNVEKISLASEDIADSATLRQPPPGPDRPAGTPLAIGWIITAPGAGSGGHTTIFRFVEALEAAGHRCVLFIYDTQGGDVSRHEDVIRTWWPGVRAEVRAVHDGLRGMDAYIATAWTTAHVLATRPEVGGRRLYLVQDYEPHFSPSGTAYALAEDTYRFGFTTITVGAMLAGELEARFGTTAAIAEFGCDLQAYTVENSGPRTGVVFYAKPGTSRRGYEMGVWALERLHTLRPDADIHTFGVRARGLPFPATVHAHLSPTMLNSLYNRCGAGLALSFTNMSLIPYELLAAGVVPVVNELPGHRLNLNNPHVLWSRATPDALALALADALDHQAAGRPTLLRESVRDLSWESARSTVVRVVEETCSGQLRSGSGPGHPARH